MKSNLDMVVVYYYRLSMVLPTNIHVKIFFHNENNFLANAAAPNPLSILTATTPGEQLCSADLSAVSPLPPYP